MRIGSVVGLLLAVAACGGAARDAAVPAPVPVAEERAAQDVRAPEPLGETVELRRRHASGDRYRVKTEFVLTETPYHADLGYDVLAEATIEPSEGGGLVARGEFLSSTLRHGDLVNPLGPSTDVTGARVTYALDGRNRVHGRELEPANAEHAMAAQEVMEGVEHVRITYPDRPVRVGESWSGGTVRWDTRPLGWVAVVMEPTFTLEAIEQRAGRRWARVRWSGELAVEPFDIMGISIAARAPITGTSVISLDDGYAGHHTIELDVKLTNANGAGGGETIARVTVAQQVDRL